MDFKQESRVEIVHVRAGLFFDAEDKLEDMKRVNMDACVRTEMI